MKNETYKILLTSKNCPEGHWIDLTSLDQKSFYEEVERLFGKNDSGFFIDFESDTLIPFEFRHAGVKDKILTDRFWDWKNYSKEDQELLVKYMEYTHDDEVTLKEAKLFFKKNKNIKRDVSDFLSIISGIED